MGQDVSKKSFKKTLNLPQTPFSMKANLVQNEPATLKRWRQDKLYAQVREASQGRPRYVFHDGPPYANGSIHLGHLLNKVLKDFVVRTRTMAGYDCPYTPGWDCHGLPIEHKVVQELGPAAREMDALSIRRKCRSYAEKFIKLQAGQMQQLLTLADYDEPYLTMAPAYEAAVLEVFARLVEEGVVYRGLKPVHWSIENRTALADAELEYYDREDTSVYVCFDVADPARLPASLGAPAGEPVSLMIWTTTPWTLPANMAVAVAPKAEYGLYRIAAPAGERLVMLADDLAAKVFALELCADSAKAAVDGRLGGCTGAALVQAGVTYDHPFMEDGRVRPIVEADYVTLEDGVGMVHTATGHGVEDYQTGLREGLEIYCPVLDDGTFDDTAPEWLRGVIVWDANDKVLARLRETGHLFHAHQFKHSYPHDWRGKSPVIFRATEQWFVDVNKPLRSFSQSMRELALDRTAGDAVRFIPGWGRNRMRGMLETRPDWCLSRQRSWGLPIPAFYREPGEVLLTAASVRAVAQVIEQKGSDVWFVADAADLLAGYDPAADPDAPAWLKEACAQGAGLADVGLAKAGDIFDVWFESGSSWNAALRRMQGDFPADLYLEGSDQHRGWFQLSLLPALGAEGQPPFRSVLTHGFMVDKDGRKMSKSLGNTLEVESLLKEFGADVCRWWVCSLNFENDIKVDHSFFKDAGESYRKVRNTIRFLLSNLSDFGAGDRDALLAALPAASVDAWAMTELTALHEAVTRAYEAFDFRRAHERLFNFCNDTLSATYLTAVKDRLYCDRPDAPRRRQSQAVIHALADALLRLLAPVAPHTADEAWAALHGPEAGSLIRETFAVPAWGDAAGPGTAPDWKAVMLQRDRWLKTLENARQARDIDNPLDLGLTVVDNQDSLLAGLDADDLADLCGVSRFTVAPASTPGEPIQVDDLRDQPRCERSWKRDATVASYTDADGETVWLSQRDAQAIGLA